MNALERIVGTIAGVVPFALAVYLDKTWGWGVGTAIWGMGVIIFIGVKQKGDSR